MALPPVNLKGPLDEPAANNAVCARRSRAHNRGSTLQRVRQRAATALTAALVVALTACASTVQVQPGQEPLAGQVATEGSTVMADDGLTMDGSAPEAATGEQPVADGGAGGTSGDGAAAVAGDEDPAAGAAPGSAADQSPGGGSSGGGSTGGGSTGTDDAGGSSPQTAPSAGAPGLTASTIKLGFEYVADYSEQNEAIGANVSSGDQRANYETLVKHYNANGGIAGRKIEPVFYEYTATRNIDEQQQASCTHFTQDDPVFAVFVELPETAYLNCLSKAGTGTWGYPALSGADDKTFRAFPGYLQPSALSLSAVGRLYAPGLRQAGFFEPEAVDGSTTIGLVTFDEPRFRRVVDREFKPGLRRVGEQLDEVVYATYAKSTNDVGRLSAEMSSAVLRFRREGVDHVTFIEYNALIAFTFLQAAESQRYRPQYGLNSTMAGQLFVDQGLAPDGQLDDARLVGWQPLFDLPARFTKPWPAQRECLRMYQEAGIRFPDRNAQGKGLLFCAGFSFLKAALEKAPGPLTVASIQRGGEALGTGWESPWSRYTSFGPGKHYGPARYLTAEFDSDCDCFKPQGRLRPIP